MILERGADAYSATTDGVTYYGFPLTALSTEGNNYVELGQEVLYSDGVVLGSKRQSYRNRVYLVCVPHGVSGSGGAVTLTYYTSEDASTWTAIGSDTLTAEQVAGEEPVYFLNLPTDRIKYYLRVDCAVATVYDAGYLTVNVSPNLG